MTDFTALNRRTGLILPVYVRRWMSVWYARRSNVRRRKRVAELKRRLKESP